MPLAQVAIHTARGRAEAVASWHPSVWSLYWVCCCKLQHVRKVCCHETRLIWGNAGPNKEHPPMSPGGSCIPQRKDGKGWAAPLATDTWLAANALAATNEGGPGPWDVQRPPSREDWCQLPPAVAPGHSMWKGHCLRANPVTWMRPTGCYHQCGGLRQHHTKRLIGWGQGKSKEMKIWSVPCHWSPTPGTPGWGRAIPSWCWGGRQAAGPPISTPQVQSPLPCTNCTGYCGMPDMSLVEGTCEHPQLWWLPGICLKVCASFEVPKAHNWAKGGHWSPPPASPSVHWEVSFYATLRCKVWQSGLLIHQSTPYPHLHEGASVLGYECPTTDSQSTSLSGRKCGGQWSCWSQLRRWRFSQLLCHPIGQRWACWGQQSLPCKTPIAVTATAEAARPTKGGPCWQPIAKANPLPPRRHTCLLLHPRKWCHCSLTTSPHALHQGFVEIAWALWGSNQWRAVQHWSSASHPKTPQNHTK